MENHFCESLALCRHNVDLEFNGEVMKPDRYQETPDHAGFNPNTMRVSKWYQKTTLKGDVSHFSSFSRTSDTVVETNLTSEKEPIEDDERLAMKIGDMPPLLPGPVSNPRIRDDQENSARTRTRCTVLHLMMLHTSMVWLQSVIYLPTICEKIGKEVELFNVSTYIFSILFNNLGSFNRKSEFRKPENLNKPITKRETTNIAEQSLLEFWWNNNAHVILTSEADSSPTEGSCLKTKAWWDVIQPEAMTC